MFQVYKIKKVNNSFYVIKSGIFKYENDAKDFIISRTILDVPELATILIDIPDKNKYDFSLQFCFTNNKYIKKRTYFIGHPLKNNLLKRNNNTLRRCISKFYNRLKSF
jgi:hypothetical protein